MSEKINEKNMVCEPQAEWGGSWTERKLEAFGKYVSAYLTIMRKHPYLKTIYFDGFAGCGDRKSGTDTELYHELLITDEEERLYQGAAERVLDLKNELSFDYHYFIDTDKEALDKLESKLYKYQCGKNPFQFRQGDCNEHIETLAKAMKDPSKKLASLVLIDPFGMHINWKSIEELKETLFGAEEVVQKVNKPIEKIAEFYTQRLKTIWKFVTEKPLRLENTRGVPIFHFVFASNNPTGVKIASQIIDKAH